MPIVVVHGVATRDTAPGYARSWQATQAFLRRYVAPVISDEPEAVAIEPAYWGGVGATFSHGGLARPRSPLLGMGAGDGAGAAPALMAEFGAALAAAGPAAPAAPASRLAVSGPGAGTRAVRLADLPPDELSDVLVAAMPELPGTDDGGARTAAWAVAADEVARDPATRAALEGVTAGEAEADVLLRLCAERYTGPEDALAGMGAGSWRPGWLTRLAESADRAAHAPGFVLSRALAEVRGPVNDVVTLFIGDVFTYLTCRGEPGRPGPIPAAVLAALRRAADARRSPDEPMVLVTHSMGGQIAFDLVTAFLPQEPHADHLRVDFWCATASQVGLFQELGLFLRDADAGAPRSPRSPGEPAPPPDGRYLGHWWNVWDYNDFISYSAAGIVAGVDDEAYSSGMSVLTAHSGYLQRPSFYRRLAAKVESARQAGYARP